MVGTLRIHDGEEQVIFEVDYDNSADWSEKADGTGYSLELANPTDNSNDFQNWYACLLPDGTPGDELEISVVLLESGLVRIRFSALPRNSYTLRYTVNVASGQWIHLQQKEFVNEPVELDFIDTLSGNVKHRFYSVSIP